jgi:hypothetical protein
MAQSKRKKPTKRATPQIKISIPKSYRAQVTEAMEWDGATRPATFALAALMQRVRRTLEQKALEQGKRRE